MDVRKINTFSKDQLLELFKKKDSSDNNKSRDFYSSIFYDFSLWPINTLRDFWLIRYPNRMRLTNFCFGNGLCLEMLIEMLNFYHDPNSDNQQRINEIIALWTRLQNNDVSDYYYYYNMDLKIDLFFNGQKRLNGKPAGIVDTGKMFNSQGPHERSEYLKPLQFAKKVRESIERNQELNYMARQELIKRGQRRIRINKALKFLKLKSVDDLFEN